MEPLSLGKPDRSWREIGESGLRWRFRRRLISNNNIFVDRRSRHREPDRRAPRRDRLPLHAGAGPDLCVPTLPLPRFDTTPRHHHREALTAGFGLLRAMLSRVMPGLHRLFVYRRAKSRRGYATLVCVMRPLPASPTALPGPRARSARARVLQPYILYLSHPYLIYLNLYLYLHRARSTWKWIGGFESGTPFTLET